MADAYLGEIRMFAGNYAPKYWALCNGQLLSVAQNYALFSLLGTIYGGNGVQTFALPDLRSRGPIHFGQGPGLSSYVLGQAGGAQAVTLLTTHLPAHNHQMAVKNAAPDSGDPTGKLLAAPNRGAAPYSTGAATTAMNPNAVAVAGASQPLSILPPYVAISYIIAVSGIFPSPN